MARVTWDQSVKPHDLAPVQLDSGEAPTRPPGSPVALHAGCACPVKSNWQGSGATAANWGRRGQASVWLVDARCPLHRWMRTTA